MVDQLLSASDLDQAAHAATMPRPRATRRVRGCGCCEAGDTAPSRSRRPGPRSTAPRAALAEVMVSLSATRAAPRPGLIEALPYEVGERPPVGAPLVIMLADGAPYARVYVPEPLRVAFAAGRRVEVTVDGGAGRFAGTVRYVLARPPSRPTTR